MKRICIVIDSISNSGGTDRVACNISQMFAKNGFSTTVYCMNIGSPYYHFNKDVQLSGAKCKGRVNKLLECVSFVKKGCFDYIIVISMGRLSAQILPLFKLTKIKSKLICSDHVSIRSFPKTIQAIKFFAYKCSDSVVVLTDDDRSYLSDFIKSSSVSTVRNSSSFECDTYSTDDIPLKEKIVLGVGRLTYQKNFMRLINIWKNIDTNGWRLCIVGDGEEKKDILTFCRQNGIDNVEVYEATNNIDSWYKKSSALAMTSRYEGLPMVLIEAKNFGVPAIAFDCQTGPVEIIDNDGYVIDYDDDKEFGSKLSQILHDPQLRQKLSRCALENSKQYTTANIYQQWMTVFNSIQ